MMITMSMMMILDADGDDDGGLAERNINWKKSRYQFAAIRVALPLTKS